MAKERLLAASSRLFARLPSSPRSIIEIIEQSNDPTLVRYRQECIEFDPNLETNTLGELLCQ